MSLLTVEGLSHGFGDRAIFEDVSFRLLRGEHIGLVGANGEGKSTFMRMVTSHMDPDEGTILWARGVKAGYLDGSNLSGSFVGDLGGQVKFNATWGLVGEIEVIEDVTRYSVGVRASF